MTLDEFKKSVYHTRLYVIIPSLNRVKLNKQLFMKKGKLDIKSLDKHLEEIYNRKIKK